MTTAEALEKVRRLLAVAASSHAEEEARTAAIMAAKLIAEHRLVVDLPGAAPSKAQQATPETARAKARPERPRAPRRAPERPREPRQRSRERPEAYPPRPHDPREPLGAARRPRWKASDIRIKAAETSGRCGYCGIPFARGTLVVEVTGLGTAHASCLADATRWKQRQPGGRGRR